MNHHLDLSQFGNSPKERVKNACYDLANGKAVILMDDPNRENEGDLIVAAEYIDQQLMAQMIRDCSGIVCLILTDEKVRQLELPPMVANNTSKNRTAFTISIEAKNGVTTGVSAADRVQTIKTAIADNARPEDLARPGHIFPIRCEKGGVLARRGHTEGSIDLCKLAGLSPCAVLCELTNHDGSMKKGQALIDYAVSADLIVLTIEDIAETLLSDIKETA